MAAGVLARRVRVTIEGDAQSIGPTGLIRINTGSGMISAIDPEDPRVTVEDIAPDYAWTDGDVVQVIATDVTFTRRAIEGDTSRWFSGSLGLPLFGRADRHITDAVRSGESRVLRHQATE